MDGEEADFGDEQLDFGDNEDEQLLDENDFAADAEQAAAYPDNGGAYDEQQEADDDELKGLGGWHTAERGPAAQWGSASQLLLHLVLSLAFWLWWLSCLLAHAVCVYMCALQMMLTCRMLSSQLLDSRSPHSRSSRSSGRAMPSSSNSRGMKRQARGREGLT